jgi:hypothetical protein
MVHLVGEVGVGVVVAAIRHLIEDVVVVVTAVAEGTSSPGRLNHVVSDGVMMSGKFLAFKYFTHTTDEMHITSWACRCAGGSLRHRE